MFSDMAICMDYTARAPFTAEEDYTARNLRDRRLQLALLQLFKPENDSEVREALQKAGRQERIGSGCDALTVAIPPNTALRARPAKGIRVLGEGYDVPTIPNNNPSAIGPQQAKPNSTGFRPDRKSAK